MTATVATLAETLAATAVTMVLATAVTTVLAMAVTTVWVTVLATVMVLVAVAKGFVLIAKQNLKLMMMALYTVPTVIGDQKI